MNINKIYVWIMKRFNISMWNAENEQVGGVYIRTQEPDGENVVKIKFTNGNTIEIKEETITDCVCEDENNLTIGYKNETGEKQLLKISTKKFEMKKKNTILDKMGVERPIIDIIDKSNKDVLLNWGKENCAKSMGVHVVSNKEAKPRKGKSYLLNNPSFSSERVEIEEKTVESYDYSIWTPNWIENAGSIFVLKTEEETMFIFPYTEYSFEVMGSLLDDGFILACIDFVSEDDEEKNKDEEMEVEEKTDIDELFKSIGINEDKCDEDEKSKIVNLKKCFEDLLALIKDYEESEEDEIEDFEEDITSLDENVDSKESEMTEEEEIIEEIFETEETEEYTNDDDSVSAAYKIIAEHMRREKINSIKFWTDEDENVHCDVKICTIYQAPNKFQ